MARKSTVSLLVLAALTIAGGSAAAAEDVRTVVVQYPYSVVFSETHRLIAEEFHAAHPDIRVVFRAPTETYDDAVQRVLRDTIISDAPDVTFQGLYTLRTLADQGAVVALDDLIAEEPDLAGEGFHEAMFEIGRQGNSIYGLPFAISLPIAYYNLDLVRRAGGDPDALPQTWDEVIALARQIDALDPVTDGVFYEWDIVGNWLWQALVFSQGGKLLDEEAMTVAFDGAAGDFGIATHTRLVKDGGMPNMTGNDGRSAFASGNLGIYISSTSRLKQLEDMIGGRFELKTELFPDVREDGRLPSGGNLAVIHSTDPDKLAAAWEMVKFWTGPRGAAIMVETTGYMPPNNKATELYLGDFYAENPNNFTAVRSIDKLTGWFAFPGENSLKITDVIRDHLQSIATGARAEEPEAVLADMARDVQALLPTR